jgi:hypothetical protein
VPRECADIPGIENLMTLLDESGVDEVPLGNPDISEEDIIDITNDEFVDENTNETYLQYNTSRSKRLRNQDDNDEINHSDALHRTDTVDLHQQYNTFRSKHLQNQDDNDKINHSDALHRTDTVDLQELRLLRTQKYDRK